MYLTIDSLVNDNEISNRRAGSFHGFNCISQRTDQVSFAGYNWKPPEDSRQRMARLEYRSLEPEWAKIIAATHRRGGIRIGRVPPRGWPWESKSLHVVYPVIPQNRLGSHWFAAQPMSLLIHQRIHLVDLHVLIVRVHDVLTGRREFVHLLGVWQLIQRSRAKVTQTLVLFTAIYENLQQFRIIVKNFYIIIIIIRQSHCCIDSLCSARTADDHARNKPP